MKPPRTTAGETTARRRLDTQKWLAFNLIVPKGGFMHNFFLLATILESAPKAWKHITYDKK